MRTSLILEGKYLHCGQYCNIHPMAEPVPTLCPLLHCATIAQAVSYKGLSSVPGQQHSQCDIPTGQTGTGTGFCCRTSVLSCYYHFTSGPYILRNRCWYSILQYQCASHASLVQLNKEHTHNHGTKELVTLCCCK